MNKCEDCVYRWKMYSSQKKSYCGYLLDTGRIRPCSADNCDCFSEGIPNRRKSLIFSDNYYQ